MPCREHDLQDHNLPISRCRLCGLDIHPLTNVNIQELVDLMVANRVEATDKVKSQPGASMEMVEHVAEIIEAKALRIAGWLE